MKSWTVHLEADKHSAECARGQYAMEKQWLDVVCSEICRRTKNCVPMGERTELIELGGCELSAKLVSTDDAMVGFHVQPFESSKGFADVHNGSRPYH